VRPVGSDHHALYKILALDGDIAWIKSTTLDNSYMSLGVDELERA
jgi:hypothetical protein